LTTDDYDLEQGKTVYEITRGKPDDKVDKLRTFLFKDYAAHAFHHLRELFGYTPEQFLVLFLCLICISYSLLFLFYCIPFFLFFSFARVIHRLELLGFGHRQEAGDHNREERLNVLQNEGREIPVQNDSTS
jgi:hypothetical protein